MKPALAREIIQLLRDQPEIGFNRLLEFFHADLCAYARSLSRNPKIPAEDLVQNVYVKLWHKREELPENFPLKNYLYKAVYHEFIDQYRKNTSLSQLEEQYTQTLLLWIETKDSEELHNWTQKLEISVAELPPRCQKIFRLSKYEGLSHQEIAEHLKISTKAVEAQISRAFRILRKQLMSKTLLFFVGIGISLQSHKN